MNSIIRRNAASCGSLALVFVLSLVPGVGGCHDPPRQEAAADAARPADPPAVASASAAAVAAPLADDAAAPAVANVADADAGPEVTPADRRAPDARAGGTRKLAAGRGTGTKVEAVAAPAPEPASTTTTTAAESPDAKRPKRAPAPMVNEDPYGNAAAPGVAPSTLKKGPMRDESPYGAAPAPK